ncbi:MAG: S9 family peptidase [Armatimonadota bacterium]
MSTPADTPLLSAERLVSLGRVTSVVPSPCGTWAAVAVSRLDADGSRYVSDLWRVPLQSGEPVPLTRGDSDDRAPCFRRDGSLGFLSNRNPRAGKPEEGDEERSQVWLLPAGGGEPRPLTDEPLGVASFRFAAAADRLLVVADVLPGVPHEEQRAHAAERRKHGPSTLRYDRMPVRYWDQWLAPAAPHLIAYDEDGESRRDLTPQADREHRNAGWDVSADGRYAAITRAIPGEDRMEDADLLLIDLESGETRTLGGAPTVSVQHPLFDPSGARIAAVRHARTAHAVGKPDLWIFDRDSGSGRAVGEEWDRWPNPHCWTADGAALLATADDGGSVPVFRVDAQSGAVTRLTPEGLGGVHDGLRVVPGAEAAVGIRHHTLHPPEPCRIPLRPGAGPELLACLSGFTVEEGARIAGVESRTTASTNGVPIQWWVVTPAGAGKKLPAVLWIHGGPIGQWSDGWHWRWNPLVAASQGYVVALPNPSGSTGFGQALVEQIWGNSWGAQCYHDLMAVTDEVERLPQVDPARIAAMGGSFGGYMTNWIGGNTDRFRCLVTHASLYHLLAFQGTTDFPVWFARHIGGAPYADPGAYDRYSPHARVQHWKSPTLVIHGEKDYRVPIGEALALFEALQHHGVPSEMVIFPDENHWILRPRNVIAWYDAVLEFLGRHL